MKELTRFIFLIILLLNSSCNRFFSLSDSDIQKYYNEVGFPMYSDTVYVGDRAVYFVRSERTVSKPVILFVHGAPGYWHLNRKFLRNSELRSKYCLVAVDRPGYGRSNYGEPEPSIEQQTEALTRLLNAIKANKAMIIARSYGCPIAVHLAARSPQQVRSLILVSPALDPKLEKFWWFSPLGKIEFFKRLMPKAINVATVEKYAHAKELRAMEGDWLRLDIPIRVFTGLDDWIVDPRNAVYAEKNLNPKHSKVTLIPDEEHFIADKRPELILKTIEELDSGLTLH